LKRLGELFNELSHRLLPASDPLKEEVEEELYDTVERARREWLAARSFFDSVTDPDLIDHAIYAVDAAEKKYLYLLKKARNSGYRVRLSGEHHLLAEGEVENKTEEV
jgi:hypothetical protein